MNLRLSLFSILAISVPLPSHAQYLAFDAYGTPLEIANKEVQYDQKQNHASGVPPTISSDHSSLHSMGNRWSAYQLPFQQTIYENTVLQFTFTLAEETVDGMQAICLDADVERTGPNGKCFVLATTQGWVSDMINVAQLTPVGGTTYHSIPIGHFFTGPVNYLAYLQDSDDANDRSLGESTISSLRLVQEDRNKLEVEIKGVAEQLENQQLSYTYKRRSQDTDDWLMVISDDGSGVQINGNQWKALPLNSPYTITHNTVLEFDIVVTEPGDHHSICLDADLNAEEDEKSCVTFMTPRENQFQILTTELVENENKRLVVPFGQIAGLLGGDTLLANYLVFIQDSDAADKRGGQSTFSNIRIYEEDRMDLKVQVFGENVTVPNIQESMTAGSKDNQDSIDHVMSVSADGKSVAAYGNTWRTFKLDTPFDVTPSTMLKFSFSVPRQVENHAICLLDGRNINDGRTDCFSASGLDITSSSSTWVKLNPWTTDGGSNEYNIWIGQYFTGPVSYLGFSQDNDKVYTPSRAEGESSWGNIEIYSLPSLKIGLDDGTTSTDRLQETTQLVIENNQVSYESSSQDNVPIGEHLAVVSDDGSSITAYGNIWRALPLPTPITAAELGDFIVSFDYVLKEAGEFHAVCFEDNLEWGNYNNPSKNKYDPKRCLLLNEFDASDNKVFIEGYQPAVGEPYRYVANLGKLFDRFYELKYFVIVSDNDVGDKSGGELTISDIQISTSLTSCLKDVGYTFQVSDCNIDIFLAGVKARMGEVNCPGNHDPLLELFAFFGAIHETDVYKEIDHICKSSYQYSEYDFAKKISSETQFVSEFIDGGTVLNYERDSEGGNLAKDGAGIAFSDEFAASHLFAWPKHHALGSCDIGAAMCCWVDSRSDTGLVDNTDVCYVDMKASRSTAHVKDGYSIYGDSNEGAVNCHGFAWGSDVGLKSALKGNALFKVGFMNNLFQGFKGNVEQIPGAPMCGCLDRMPVVTKADCTKVADDTSFVDVTLDAARGVYKASFTMGTIEYSDCGDLNSYYKTVVGADSANADYMDTKIVGDGGCRGAINDFLAEKGLFKTGSLF